MKIVKSKGELLRYDNKLKSTAPIKVNMVATESEHKENKSLEYLLKRKQDKNLPNDSVIQQADLTRVNCLDFFDTAKKVMGLDVFNRIFESNEINLKCRFTHNDKQCEVPIRICRNSNGEFDYYTSAFSYNDGTMLFHLENAQRLVQKILYAETFNSGLYTQEQAEELFGSGEYGILYEVGDIVETGTIVESPDKDKPWLTFLSCYFLPLKMRFEKN